MTTYQKLAILLSAAALSVVPAAAGAQGLNLDLDLGASATTSTSAPSAPSDGTDAEADARAAAALSADLDLTIDLDRDDDLSGTARISSASMVATGADLDAFARGRMESDERIESMQLGSDELSFTYDQRARLLGFYPMTVAATATVDADGSIEISYPWYGFMLSTNEDELEADLESRVAGALSGGVVVEDGESRMTAQGRARVLTVLHDAMRSSLDAELGGEASANAR